jgi:ABC-type nitrate/sulfonate/bicarbonate transport system ATPase subunit
MIGAVGVSMLYATTGGRPNWALDDVSFELSAGEFVCAVGPSGCGKTTLLNLIAGFIRPARGSILLDGKPIEGPGPDRGVVFQEYGLFPWLSVRRNIEFGLRERRVPRAERMRLTDQYLGMIGMRQAADRYPFELSGGMRQRVAVARALVNRPRLMLMDEPFGAVDAMTRASLQQELVRLWLGEKFACFFITHSIDEAVLLGERVFVMSPHPGRLRSVIGVDLEYPRDKDATPFRDIVRRVDAELRTGG